MHMHHGAIHCGKKKPFLFFPSAVNCWTHNVCFDDTNGEYDDAEDGDDDEYGEFETEEIHLRTCTDGNTRLQRVIASYK